MNTSIRSESPASGTSAGEHAYGQKRRVTLVGAVVNVLLAIGKVVFGIIGQSQALVVDGVHSLSDLISDGIVLAAARVGSKGPDADHPYGHARIETAATIGVGVLLLAVAAGFVYDAALRLIEPERLLTPGWIALGAAVASVLAKEALYHYTVRVGRQTRSPLIEANAWHHRSDALSSVVVVVGVGGTMLGAFWFDALAAIIVAVMVGAVGGRFAWSAMRELVDTGLGPDSLAELRTLIRAVGGVRAHHGLRTRRMGADVLVDVHVMVDPWVSVSEGHRIADEVRERLIGHIEDVSEVLVHVDHELDLEEPDQAARPPLRPQIMIDLQRAWTDAPEVTEPRRILLHYAYDKVDVELVLPPGSVAPEKLEALAARLQSAAAELGYVRNVQVLIG